MDLRDLPTETGPNDGQDDWDGEGRQAVGLVPMGGRGSLPFLLLHGESLVAVASWALGETGTRLLDLGATWESVQELDADLVLHDPLCPGTPVDFLRAVIEDAVAHEEVAVGVRPVTDTVNEAEAGRVGDTVDRAGLVAVASPVVVPAAVLAGLERPAGLPDELGEVGDLAELVGWLAERVGVRHVEAPASARRVVDASDVELLEAL